MNKTIRKNQHQKIRITKYKLNQISTKKQRIVISYVQNHFEEILAEAEKENRINKGIYTIDDFNEETQQAILNIENQNNLIVCQNEQELYNQLGI